VLRARELLQLDEVRLEVVDWSLLACITHFIASFLDWSLEDCSGCHYISCSLGGLYGYGLSRGWNSNCDRSIAYKVLATFCTMWGPASCSCPP
jgi:hypothetical protein